MPFQRRLGAVGVGLLMVVGAAACSSDPIADYVGDARGTLSEADSAGADGNGLIFAEKAICSMGGAGPG